ncbi:hypothetical protein Aph01nite_76810 [Acrocarpospora phusangensis]|uniref:Uncharacterized protein n=1 Tax=Acrocarpospora phusangensis TaxID=1070424 RepID=A0A919UP87_9ACTN|nr:hypothetical protein [Acrocarpospora phusangensis]GIH29371.1 hypothetical protein Aph01nite_76810 [Acrocarpospora phusangensis]
MGFANQVVAGTTLVRQAIKSPNYIPNVSGWTVNRDGSAEFNNLFVRGGFQIGAAPSPPNARIVGQVVAGQPTVEFYDGTNPTPAKITAYAAGPVGGIEIYSGDSSAEEVEANWSGEALRFRYTNNGPDQQFVVMSIGYLGAPIYSVASANNASGTNNMEYGLDETIFLPDNTKGLWYSTGEILVGSHKLDANMPGRLVDGKVHTGSVTPANSTSTTDVNIPNANMQNVYLEDGYAYQATVRMPVAGTVAGDRASIRLWDGTPGFSQLSRDFNIRIPAALGLYETVTCTFLWKQIGTTTISNLNISVARLSGTGTVSAQADQNYSSIVEKLGRASVVSGL